MEKDPIINCHTHIFTGDHVPPFLARTFIPAPLYFLLPLSLVVRSFRWWYKKPGRIKYKRGYKNFVKTRTSIRSFFDRLGLLSTLAGYYISLFAFFILYKLAKPILPAEETWISRLLEWLYNLLDPIFPHVEAKWLQILVVFFVFIFFRIFRNLVFAVAKLLWKVLGKLPGKQTKEMASRYLSIGRYAFHKEQKTILSKLKSQYPSKSRFVILPMDMDYMEAGKSKIRYRDQMQMLLEVKEKATNKNLIYPFVFADPRRMVEVEHEKGYKHGDKTYFTWSIGTDGNVVLGDCFIKDFIETHGFSGIKIYPALGYYPFDEKLLPLWKYAADNQIPVLTHCIRGTIFYRGPKKREWNEHPVFQQAMRQEDKKDTDGFEDDEYMEQEEAETTYIPLVLPQSKNVDFSINFTHPMNYLCILDEEQLRKLISSVKEKDPATKLVKLFGYTNAGPPLKHNLSHLKICFGHFGGEDEWKRYFRKRPVQL